MAKKKEPTFEELLEQTETAVEKLESGELSLQDSMEEYEKGVNNLKRCSELIEQAQEKVKQLINAKNGGVKLTDFDEPDLDEE
jgi:exodeoxyribonuclease VII small subunit